MWISTNSLVLIAVLRRGSGFLFYIRVGNKPEGEYNKAFPVTMNGGWQAITEPGHKFGSLLYDCQWGFYLAVICSICRYLQYVERGWPSHRWEMYSGPLALDSIECFQETLLAVWSVVRQMQWIWLSFYWPKTSFRKKRRLTHNIISFDMFFNSILTSFEFLNLGCASTILVLLPQARILLCPTTDPNFRGNGDKLRTVKRPSWCPSSYATPAIIFLLWTEHTFPGYTIHGRSSPDSISHRSTGWSVRKQDLAVLEDFDLVL